MKKIVNVAFAITNMKTEINKLIINGHLIDWHGGKEKITLKVLRKCWDGEVLPQSGLGFEESWAWTESITPDDLVESW